MERKIELFKKEIIDNEVSWTPIDGTYMEVPSTSEEQGADSVIVELFVKVDDDETVEGNNSFYMVCNETWLHIIQNRCDVKLVLPFNFQNESRFATLSFYHNADSYVSVNLIIEQTKHEYSVNIISERIVEEDNKKYVSLDSLEKEEIKFNVECVGGRGKFKIRKTKKYKSSEFLDENNEIIFEPDKYDNCFLIEKCEDNSGFNLISYGNINSIYKQDESDEKQLDVESYYYVISVCHADCIDAIDEVIIKYVASEETIITEEPSYKRLFTFLRLTEPSLNFSHDDEIETDSIVPSMTCDATTLLFNSTKETKIINVETVPEDSLIRVKKMGSFIEKAKVNGHEIRITVKNNPFTVERACLCYIINAEYPELTIPVTIKQIGKN